MRRLSVAVLATMAYSTAALAQTAVPGNYVVNAGGSTNLTLTGTPGQQYAVIASVTSFGFTYAGVALSVGTDVAIITIGALDGAGNAVVPIVPPFPQRDRYYVQAVFTTNGFASITASNGVVLLNNQEAREYMPAGGIVESTGILSFGTPGITVTRTGVGVYRLDHAGLFSIPTVLPSITATGATVLSVGTDSNVTTVTLSADAGFFFTLQPVRR